jgi:hypothetical protein
MLNFRTFVENDPFKTREQFGQNTVGTHNDRATAAFLSSSFTGSKDLGVMGLGVPETDLSLPTVTRESEIMKVLNAPATKDPRRANDKSQKDLIKVIMRDGTTIHLTFSEYKRINEKKPIEPGQKLTVVFRRNPSDSGSEPSKIINIT